MAKGKKKMGGDEPSSLGEVVQGKPMRKLDERGMYVNLPQAENMNYEDPGAYPSSRTVEAFSGYFKSDVRNIRIASIAGMVVSLALAVSVTAVTYTMNTLTIDIYEAQFIAENAPPAMTLVSSLLPGILVYAANYFSFAFYIIWFMFAGWVRKDIEKKGTNILFWLKLTVTNTLYVVLLAALMGNKTVGELVYTALVFAGAMVASAFMESQRNTLMMKGNSENQFGTFLSYIPLVFAWVIIIGIFVTFIVQAYTGINIPPAYAIAMLFGMLSLFIGQQFLLFSTTFEKCFPRQSGRITTGNDEKFIDVGQMVHVGFDLAVMILVSVAVMVGASFSNQA